MAENRTNRRQVKIHFRKSSLLVKAALIAVLILSIAALLVLRSALADTQAQTDALRAEAAQTEQANTKLRHDIAGLGTVEGIVRLAREKLGLVEPGTVIIEPEN